VPGPIRDDGRSKRRIVRIAVLIGLMGLIAGVVGLAAAGGGTQLNASSPRYARVQPGFLAAHGQRPANLRRPAISGTAQVGRRLRASRGSWSRKPRSYAYQWWRCDSSGKHCKRIAGATTAAYTPAERDIGATLRVTVVASSRSGRSKAALSAHTRLVARASAPSPPSSGAQHLEYVFNDGPVNVYDIDNGFRLVETFTIPGTSRGVRGVAVAPATHMMFISYGGDGGGNGNGSVLAYDLVSRRVVWSVNLNTGIDSGAVSADGKLLYMPDGENASNGNWYILDTANGNVIGKIETPGNGPHDGVMSADGKLLQLGDRNYSHLLVYNTQTGKLQQQTGSLEGGVRPNTINGSDSISFTTATGFDGFQVSAINKPGMPVLYTDSFGGCSGPFTTCSHGISLSPDNKQVYVIDTVHKQVQAWNVHGVAEGIAPTHLANVPVDGLEGQEKGCAYDCGRDGWLQHSLDGRYVFVGDSGDVIETATQKVVARIDSLLNSRKFVEIDWSGGVPIASSGRQGIGY
jgi:DNA-binding beta-propeller fold protein YncE